MLALVLSLTVLASFIWSRLATSVALAGWSALADAHWTERARVAWPVVVDRVFLVVGLPAIACLLATMAGVDAGAQLGLAAAAALGALVGTRDATRQIFPSVTLSRSLRARSVHALASLPLGLALAAAALTPPSPLIATIVTSVLLFLSLAWTRALLPTLARLGLAEPPPARLQALLRRFSSQAELAVIASPSPNAWAFPLTNQVLVSDTLLAALDDDELAAILAHELGHLAEPRWAKRARATLGLFHLPLPLLPLCAALDQLWLGVALIALPLVLATALAQHLERLADRWAAARIAPADLARALEKVHALSYTPAVMTGSATHPSLWSRMHEAGVAPSWPRPAPPRRGIGRLSVMVALTLVITLLASLHP